MELMYTAHVPAGEGPFPTVIALHGWGANAHDLFGLAPFMHRGQALVLCPEGPVPVEAEQGMSGYGWYPESFEKPAEPAAIAAAGVQLDQFLAAAADHFPIDSSKLVLMGFSQGGVLAYQLGLHQPERFAGLVSLCSLLPEGLLTGVSPQSAHAQLPVLVINGDNDPWIPVAQAQETRDQLQELGVSLVYREYEMAHELRPEALRELVGWLDDKVFEPASPAG